MLVYFLSDNLVHLLLLISRRQEGNSDPDFDLFFCFRYLCLLISVLVLCSLLSLTFVCILILFFSRTRRESKSRYWASNKDHFCCFVVGFAANGFLAGVLAQKYACGVGGQATQPGSARTPSPSLQPGGINPQGSGATMASRRRQKGQTVKLRGNPEGQRYRPGVATSYGHHVVAWG